MPLVIGGVVVTVPGQLAPSQGKSVPHLQMWRQVRLNLLQYGPGMIVNAFDIFMAWASSEKDISFENEAKAAWDIHQAMNKQLGEKVVQDYIVKVRREELAQGPASVWLALKEELKRQQEENPLMWGVLGSVITEPRAVHVDVPAPCRRLDSLAWIIHQALARKKPDPGCVAVAYTGDGKQHQFLVSTNNNQAFNTKSLQAAVTEFLNDPKIKQGNVDAGLRVLADLGLDRSTNYMSKEERDLLAGDDVGHHLAKVAQWLAKDLGMDLKAAVSSLSMMGPFKGIFPHAEVALLIELVNTQGLSALPPKLPCTSQYDMQEAQKQRQRQKENGVLTCAKSPFHGPCYLGISYLCCQHCAYVVAAFNQWADLQKLPRIGVRGFHTVDRGGWEFFETDGHLMAATAYKNPKPFADFYKTKPIADLVQLLKQQQQQQRVDKDDSKEAPPKAMAQASNPQYRPKERHTTVKTYASSVSKNSKVYKRDRSPSPPPARK